MAIKVSQNEEISDGGREGIGSVIRWGGANRGGVHIEKRERGGVVKRDVDPDIIRVGIKRKEKEGRKFREGWALPDENDNAAASVRGIRRENAGPGVGAIRAQSRESRNPERGRGVEIGFLDADKVDRMGRKKVK